MLRAISSQHIQSSGFVQVQRLEFLSLFTKAFKQRSALRIPLKRPCLH